MLSFASDHPVLTFLLVWLVLHFLRAYWVRLTRTIMVALRGWPPAHLDADGDWPPQ